MNTSEYQNRTIIDTIPALVWSARPDGSAEFFNRRWLDYSGLSEEEARDWGWTAIVHPDDLSGLSDYWRSILASGESGEVEGRLRRFDGVYKWFLFRATPLRDETGQVVKWYGTNTDIDDRKHAEEALRVSEQSLQLLVDNIPGFVWTMTATGNVELVNQQMLDYFSKTSEELKDWAEFLHPDDRAQVIDHWRSTIETGQPYDVEHRLRGADGIYRWFHCSGLPLRNAEGRTIRWYNLLTDIEDRRRAEDALRASEHSSRLVVDTIPGLVCTTTAEGKIENANHRFLEYFGVPVEELNLDATTRAVHPDDLPRVYDSWRRSVQTGDLHDVEQRLRGADGSYRWFQVRALPLRETRGRIIRWYALFTDIDDRKRAEQKLRASEAFLLEAQRLSHTGSWRHDLSTGVVVGTPEILRMFDVKADEDASSAEFFFGRIHPDDRLREAENYDRARTTKGDFESDYRIVLPDGSIKYIHNVGHPKTNEAGDLVEFVGTAMDVTEQSLARVELERAFSEIKLLKDELYKENLALRDEVDRVSMFEEIVGTSEALQTVLSRVAKVGPTDSTVLITGETGTGKELIARAIHKQSHRSQRAFVSVNCAALAPSLIHSELFGHEKGAFTGATQRRLGRFELAEGGTIFLDEVGELPADTQVALLRVLQEREFERVGGRKSIRVDVRVIAATNRNLEAAKAGGMFRPDLFYRLNVFPIQMPPLRERREDILTLLEYFVHRFARKLGKTFARIDRRTVELFRSYDWPGNIRELQNVVERSVIVSPDDVFCVDEAWLSSDASKTHTRERVPDTANGNLSREREIIEAVLAETRGRVYGLKGAAAKLRLPPSTLDSRIKKLKIQKNRFKLRQE